MGTQTITIVDILFATIVCATLWYLIFFLFRDYFTDSFRQSMFTLRDNLFDEARNGLVDFNHPAYGLLRETMNGYLRFGHQLSALSLIIFYALPSSRKALKMPAFSFEIKWGKKTKGLTKDQLERLTGYRNTMQKLVIKYLWKSSPTLLFLTAACVLVLIPAILAVLLRDRLLGLLSAPVSNINSAAMAYGKS